MRWEKEVLSWPGGLEERYLVTIPVFGRMVLRRHRDIEETNRKPSGVLFPSVRPWGPWTIGQFGEHGHELRPCSARGAKAAAKRYLRSQLREAMEVIG